MAFSQGQTRWQSLMQQIGASDSLDTFERLMVAYGEQHRFYHTAEHLAACLQVFAQVRDLAKAPAEVELALWFHDAVYDVRSSTNELDSAQWVMRFLKGTDDSLGTFPVKKRPAIQAPKPPMLGALNPVPPSIGGLGGPSSDIAFSRKHLTINPEHVYNHILATAHLASTPDLSADSALVVSIDLTILGQPPAIYDQFEANIRREYQHVPMDRYRQKRRAVLEHFLNQSEIFSIAHFRDRYERAARRNLESAILTLS